MPTLQWTVTWPGWFGASDKTNDKQSADKATEECWRLITTPLPRDVETEIDIITAHIRLPPPNSVLAEGMGPSPAIEPAAV